MRLRAISVDPGVDFAVAWSVEGEVHARNSMRWDLRVAKDPGPRYLLLWALLKKEFTEGADQVFVESRAAGLGFNAAAWAYGYLATMQTWSAVHGAEVVVVFPGKVRKWATGRGVATKAERAGNKTAEKDRMRAAAVSRWPNQAELAVIDHNRIDALWTLAWGLR